MSKPVIKKVSLVATYKRMWPIVKPYWFRCLLATVITLPIGALDAVIALALKPFMDTVVVEQNGATPFNLPLYVIPIFIILFTLVQSALEYGSAYLSAWTGGKITLEMKKQLYQKLLVLDSAFLDKFSSGMVVSRFDTDPNTACTGLLKNVKTFTTRVFSSIALVGVLIYTSWQLAIIAIVVLGFSLYPVTKIRKKIKHIVAQTVIVNGQVLTAFNETYAGSKTISAYNLHSYQKQKFFDILTHSFKLTIKNTQRTAWLSPVMHIIIALGMAAAIWYGSYLITSKTITAGDFVAFITAMLMLYTPIKNIGKNFNAVQLSLMAIERVFEMIDMPTDIVEAANARDLSAVQKEIVFKNVDFAYEPEKPVLKNINLTIKKGETVALVGNSGGGKTTVVSLLPRFYDVGSGSITIDGTDVRDLTLTSLREQMAVVFQDNFLFSGTIGENILLGKPNASEQEIQTAVQNACLEEFISSLPNGLNTEIGERGVLLSGGQKQRIAIARAFLKNAPVVILDEATSALDNKSEAVVQQAIDNLMRDRTVIVIAHRLSTVQNADKIVVINDGQIVEEGAHADLMARQGAYCALYEAQFKTKAGSVA